MISMSRRAHNDGHLTRQTILAWIVACALAELLGIALGALWWVAMDQINPSPTAFGEKWLMLALKALSGLVEGVVLGGLQALLLRRIYPSFPSRAWVIVTAGLAILGWGIGSSFSIFGAAQTGAPVSVDFSIGQTLVFASLFGVLVGALFGAAQATVLGRVAQKSRFWILGNMIGWALALPVIYLAASSGSEEPTQWQVAIAGLASGVIAGLVVGVATGIALRWIPPRAD